MTMTIVRNATLAAAAVAGLAATAGCGGAWPPACGSEEVNADTWQVTCGCRDEAGAEAIATWNFCYDGTADPGLTQAILECNAAATDLTLRGGLGVACGPIHGEILTQVGVDNCPTTVGVACEDLGSASGALLDASAQPLHGWQNPRATYAGSIDTGRSYVELTVDGQTAAPALTGEIYVTGGDCPGSDCAMRVDGLQLWSDPFTLHGRTVDELELVDWGPWNGQKRADDSYKFSAADASVKLSAAIDGDRGAIVGEPVGIPGGQFYTSATPLPGGGTAPHGYMTIEGTFSFGDGQARVFLVFIFGNGAPTATVSSRFVSCDVAASGDCGWVFDGSWSLAFDGGPVAEHHWYDADGDLLGNSATLADPIGATYPIYLNVVDSAGFVGSTAVGESAGPQRSGEHGWVWANQTATASYTPSPGYQYNSTGATNRVTRSSTGSYAVRFTGLAGSGGNVQVTAYGSDAAYCKSAGWGSSGSDLLANVRCFRADGSLVDSRFNALFYREQISSGSGGTTAYLWANASTSADYAPASGYSYNDTGATNRVRRSATGSYTAELPGITNADASVLVTAYGSNADRCQAAGWYVLLGSTYVSVHCTDASGHPGDTPFNLSYTVRGIPGLGSSNGRDNAGAYAWASQPTSSSYTPTSSYANSDLGGALRVRRAATGVYQLDIPHDAAISRDTVLVTAYGADGRYCKSGGWSRGSTTTTVTIRCFDGSGAPIDTRFDASYLTSNDR